MGSRRYLLADVGATHTRLAVAGGEGTKIQPVRLETAAVRDGDSLLQLAGRSLPLAGLSAACIALAGPVAANAGRLTNGSLVLDGNALTERLGCPVQVINDFHALAMALPFLQRLRQVGGTAGPAADGPHVKAVLGPGSGLGMGMLIPQGDGWRALDSEGGHADLAPGSPLEIEILTLLSAAHGHVSWETVLSGPGLVNLYRAVCAVWGVRPQEVGPEWITANGVAASDPVCHQTLEIFFSLLGAAAGNLALTAAATGGVYIGGGIVPALAEFAAESPMRRRFEERGALSSYAAPIPLWIILDEEPGLLGALARVRGTDRGISAP
jgi:glucokinase